MGVQWREKHYIHSDNCDYKKRCKLSTLLEWMQRAGDAQLGHYGVSLDEMIRQGMAWMLVTIDLEWKRLPVYGETIEMVTWNRGATGVQWQRDFRIYGPDSADWIAQARTSWVLVDLNKRRILRASACPYDLPVHPDDCVGGMPRKVEVPAGLKQEHAYDMTVRVSSIDMNGHLNNARFGDICLDAMQPEELERGLSRFRITYHREAVLNDKIAVIRSAWQDGHCFISGISDEGTAYFDAVIAADRDEMHRNEVE